MQDKLLLTNRRNLANNLFARFESKMLSIRKDQEFHETYNEAIKAWIPECQKKYTDSQAFVFLCQMIKKYCENKDFEESRAALRLAKENFENYCETMELLKE